MTERRRLQPGDYVLGAGVGGVLGLLVGGWWGALMGSLLGGFAVMVEFR